MRLPMTVLNLVIFCLQFFYPWFDVSPTNNTGSDPQQTFRDETYQPLPIRAANVAQAPFTLYLPDIASPVKAPSKLTAIYRNGQTFITWDERADLQGEKYRVYRSSQPIDADTLYQATFLGEVGKDSARFYENRFINRNTQQWQDRFSSRLVIQNLGAEVPAGTGLLVWTLATQDFGGATSGPGYYAVTVTPAGGAETLDPANTVGPVTEAVANPLPVEINSTTVEHLSTGAHVFIQYMDLRNWNPTFHAPNSTNGYYGMKPTDPGVADDLQYAYDYVVYLPTASMCGGKLPAKLPVIIDLHGHRANTYISDAGSPDTYCTYVILPEDETDTWWFGFAQNQDYRKDANVAAGDTIVNYTEQRVLRMLYDLMRSPLGPQVDAQRVYVQGQSMGGSGALAFAERYPNVFAAAYASQPVTNYLTAGVTNTDWVADVTIKWGAPALNLPVHIDAPNGWAAPIQKYDGVGVWDWQNYQDNASATKLTARLYDDMAPIGIIHGTIDQVVTWSTQGGPMNAAFNLGRRAWASMDTADNHYWMYYYGLPPTLAPLPQNVEKYFWVPYRNLSVVKNETVPGLSNLSSDSSATPGGRHNETIAWSASWDSWDGSPVDQTALWQISLCTVVMGKAGCGGSGNVTVNVTPRRLQQFVVTPGASYTWQNRQTSNNNLVASGTVTADSGGLLLIPGFTVSPSGNRLIIKPKG